MQAYACSAFYAPLHTYRTVGYNYSYVTELGLPNKKYVLDICIKFTDSCCRPKRPNYDSAFYKVA